MRLLNKDLWTFSNFLVDGSLSRQTIYLVNMMSAALYRKPRGLDVGLEEELDVLDISEFPDMYEENLVFDLNRRRGSKLSDISIIYESKKYTRTKYNMRKV